MPASPAATAAGVARLRPSPSTASVSASVEMRGRRSLASSRADSFASLGGLQSGAEGGWVGGAGGGGTGGGGGGGGGGEAAAAAAEVALQSLLRLALVTGELSSFLLAAQAP